MPKSKEITDSHKATKSQEYVVESSSDSDTRKSTYLIAKTTSSKMSISPTRESGSGTDSPSVVSSSQESSTSDSEDLHGKKRKADTAKATVANGVKKAKTSDALKARKQIRNEPESIPGYSLLTLDASDFVTDSSDMFLDLNKKQVWHITAPASVPITAIEWLDIPAALRGEPILHHKGASYNMSVSMVQDEALLLPQGSSRAYSKVETGISRSFHLREIAPKAGTETAAKDSLSPSDESSTNGAAKFSSIEFVAKEEGSRRPARQQPPGLLMRYRPYGSTKANNKKPYRLSQPDGKEDEEVDVATRSFSSVRHIDSDEASQSTGAIPKDGQHRKNSKHKRSSPHSEIVLAEEAMDVDSTKGGIVPETPQGKVKKSKDRSGSEKKKKHKDKS